jgi:hypothetical protein
VTETEDAPGSRPATDRSKSNDPVAGTRQATKERSKSNDRVGAEAPSPPSGRVQYKGADLDASRGPGLGCFRFQLIVLAVFIVLTPLSVAWHWPEAVSAVLLFVVIGLLLTTGQTIIFLLRLVAADRRSRRRPLASSTRTVGELEDETAATGSSEPDP